VERKNPSATKSLMEKRDNVGDYGQKRGGTGKRNEQLIQVKGKKG